MPPIRQDLSKVADSVIVPAGDYLATVTSFKEGVSKGAKTKGSTTLNTRFKLVDEPGSVFETFIFADTTLWKWKQFLSACGFDKDQLNDPEFEVDTDDLVGLDVLITVGVRAAEGEYGERNEIKRFRRADEAEGVGSWEAA